MYRRNYIHCFLILTILSNVFSVSYSDEESEEWESWESYSQKETDTNAVSRERTSPVSPLIHEYSGKKGSY